MKECEQQAQKKECRMGRIQEKRQGEEKEMRAQRMNLVGLQRLEEQSVAAGGKQRPCHRDDQRP